MKNYQAEYAQKCVSADDAMQLVRSGDRVFIGFVNSIAYVLADALWKRRGDLSDITIGSGNCLRQIPLLCSEEENPFSVASPFLGPAERRAAKIGRSVDSTSFHLSQVDLWFHDIFRPTVCFFEVSAPDKNGYMSYGATGGCVNEIAKQTADRIIVQVNHHVPYTQGQQCRIHVSEVDAIVEADDPITELPEDQVDDVTQQISEHVLDMVPDGATIQLGIGKLSTAIGYGLRNRNDLGIHSELFSEPMMDLMENGNVTNRLKGYRNGKSVFAFAMGSRKLYSFMDHNTTLYNGTFLYVNDPRIIARNRRMISINSAMAIDLYGQVAADCLGGKQHSAVGGQIDFVRGAQWSKEGKSVIATASSFLHNGNRQSKIVAQFPAGTAVTTPRSDVQYIATEYGCVNLKLLNIKDRARAIIQLAHPDFRDQLTEQARALGIF